MALTSAVTAESVRAGHRVCLASYGPGWAGHRILWNNLEIARDSIHIQLIRQD